jgi:hypothetical protein
MRIGKRCCIVKYSMDTLGKNRRWLQLQVSPDYCAGFSRTPDNCENDAESFQTTLSVDRVE